MIKSIMTGAAVLVLALTSCQNDKIVGQDADSMVSVKAMMGNGSRTAVNGGGEVTWSEGDKMLVYGGETEGVLTLEGDGGSDEGTFSGFVQGSVSELTTALYPAEMASSDGTITLSEITYPNSNSPMVATWNNKGLQFSHLASMVRVFITGLPEGSHTLTLSGVGIAGTAKLNGDKLTGFSTEVEKVVVNSILQNAEYVDVPVFPTTAFSIQLDGYDALPVEQALEVGKMKCLYLNVVDGVMSISDIYTGWYNEDDTEFTIYTVEEFKGFSQLVAENNTFEGKTVKLGKDIDLYEMGAEEPVSINPIGNMREGGRKPFCGTFDGDNHKLLNLYQSGCAFGYEWGRYGSLGLFAQLKDATVKNLTVEGFECFVEGGDVSFIAGDATGDCVFENITIKNSTIATYNNGCGSIIAWSGGGNYTFKNITLESDVVLAGLWGSFDSSIGGIVGQAEPGATYNFENVTINCRIDAYNDCTASYDYYNYRMCGMVIGRCEETTKINGENYPDLTKYNITCKNVTVNYGDWMNYHYCEPTPGYNSGRGMRVESGYAYDGLPADFDHSQCVDNHYNCIPFDQLIGGNQLGVKGLREVEGIKVNYPASYNPEN